MISSKGVKRFESHGIAHVACGAETNTLNMSTRLGQCTRRLALLEPLAHFTCWRVAVSIWLVPRIPADQLMALGS